MVIFSPQREALDEFLDELRGFSRTCCVASDRELAKAAPEVKARYKGDIKLCQLSPAALSETFSRKRRRPPRWDWVATYVLTCLHIARRSGAELRCDGPTTLQQWYERYQVMLDRHSGGRSVARSAADGEATEPAAKPTVQDAGGNASGDGGTGVRPTSSRGPAPADGPVSSSPLPPPGPPTTPSSRLAAQILRWQDLHDAALADWMYQLQRQQSMAHRRYYELLGQHGVDLLMAAEGLSGDPEAACRLGILLLCHNHPHEGMAWLRTAAEDGDAPAKVLINSAPSRLLEMAAELAYEFTLPGYAQDLGTSPTYAEVYYRAAATAGHMGAAVRLGLIFEARGETIAALHTYARAADRCHPGGVRHFQRLNHQLTLELNRRYREDLPPAP